jgi:hypothetical protein
MNRNSKQIDITEKNEVVDGRRALLSVSVPLNIVLKRGRADYGSWPRRSYEEAGSMCVPIDSGCTCLDDPTLIRHIPTTNYRADFFDAHLNFQVDRERRSHSR